MKRKITIAICLIFLASGLIRIGVSALMIGQAQGWWHFDGEAAVALADTRRVIGASAVNLAGFTPLSYFAFIAAMGVTISAGALGVLWRRQWGLGLIGLYLLSHAALFVNFWTVNPKIWLWALTVVMAGVLVWAQGTDRRGAPVAAG